MASRSSNCCRWWMMGQAVREWANSIPVSDFFMSIESVSPLCRGYSCTFVNGSESFRTILASTMMLDRCNRLNKCGAISYTITLQGNLWVSTTHWTYGKSSMSIKESNTSMLWESDKAANHQGIRRMAAIFGTALPFSINSNLLSSDMISRTTVHFWSVQVNASCT